MSYEYVNTLKRLAVIAVAAATSGVALADADLDQKIADPANWAAQAGDYANHRFSELKQINASNVGKLQVAFRAIVGKKPFQREGEERQRVLGAALLDIA